MEYPEKCKCKETVLGPDLTVTEVCDHCTETVFLREDENTKPEGAR